MYYSSLVYKIGYSNYKKTRIINVAFFMNSFFKVNSSQ